MGIKELMAQEIIELVDPDYVPPAIRHKSFIREAVAETSRYENVGGTIVDTKPIYKGKTAVERACSECARTTLELNPAAGPEEVTWSEEYMEEHNGICWECNMGAK